VLLLKHLFVVIEGFAASPITGMGTFYKASAVKLHFRVIRH
jgi:hypothetical protein